MSLYHLCVLSTTRVHKKQMNGDAFLYSLCRVRYTTQPTFHPPADAQRAPARKHYTFMHAILYVGARALSPARSLAPGQNECNTHMRV